MTANNANKMLHNYKSNVDKFLDDFAKSHQPSASEQREIAKAKRIHDMRDNADAVMLDDDLFTIAQRANP